MGEGNRINPLLLGLGLVAGAAGALFFSKKENRKKAVKAISKAKSSSKSWLTQTIEDVSAFADQSIEAPKKKTVSKKK